MPQAPEFFIKRALNTSFVKRLASVQSLWSGYGEIARFEVVRDQKTFPVILKSIDLSTLPVHPRGWASEFSHQRKLDSYLVEANWYQNWATALDTNLIPVAKLLGCSLSENKIYLVLEDLDQLGFPIRFSSLTVDQAVPVINWLAAFHARFLNVSGDVVWPSGLWERGTYWHLATRPQELEAMAPSIFKERAHAIDRALSGAKYKSLVHGDAKVANFCFSECGQNVAAVDFQYVGGGVGSQDLAYFLGSCIDEYILDAEIEHLLDIYFSELYRCLVASGESDDLADKVCNEWRWLFPIAWADFQRFMLGWCPTHQKLTDFSKKMSMSGIDRL